MDIKKRKLQEMSKIKDNVCEKKELNLMKIGHKQVKVRLFLYPKRKGKYRLSIRKIKEILDIKS